MITNPKPVRVLYLDLDDTVRKGFDALGRFVNEVTDVEVFEKVPALMRRYKNEGWRIVAISNQGGVALGYLPLAEARSIMLETNRQCENLFDKMLMCVHHPDAKEQEMAVCWCRKPRAGLVIEAAIELGRQYPDEYFPPHMALFVGDREEDKLCAEAANIKFMAARKWRGEE